MIVRLNFVEEKRLAAQQLWLAPLIWLPAEDYSSEWFKEFRNQVEQVSNHKLSSPEALKNLVKFGEAEFKRVVDHRDWGDPLNFERIKTALELQVSAVLCHRQWVESLDPDLMEQWPCWEVVSRGNNTPMDQRRLDWELAGGKLFQGRMIATKWDAVWKAFSFAQLPHPPFNIEHDVDVEDVELAEAVQLGVLS